MHSRKLILSGLIIGMAGLLFYYLTVDQAVDAVAKGTPGVTTREWVSLTTTALGFLAAIIGLIKEIMALRTK